MKIIVTGSAGFIGSALGLRLLDRGDSVIGIDNHNEYYDTAIKKARVARQKKYSNYTHYRIDLSDQKSLNEFFKNHKPQRVVNLAAQAGDVPDTYADSKNLKKQFGYKPSTSVLKGVAKFVECYKNYYNLK